MVGRASKPVSPSMLLCSTRASYAPQQRLLCCVARSSRWDDFLRAKPFLQRLGTGHLPEKCRVALPRCVPAAAGSNLSKLRFFPETDPPNLRCQMQAGRPASLSPRQFIQPQLRFRYQQPARHTAYDTRTFTSTTLLHHCMRTPPEPKGPVPLK